MISWRLYSQTHSNRVFRQFFYLFSSHRASHTKYAFIYSLNYCVDRCFITAVVPLLLLLPPLFTSRATNIVYNTKISKISFPDYVSIEHVWLKSYVCIYRINRVRDLDWNEKHSMNTKPTMRESNKRYITLIYIL